MKKIRYGLFFLPLVLLFFLPRYGVAESAQSPPPRQSNAAYSPVFLSDKKIKHIYHSDKIRISFPHTTLTKAGKEGILQFAFPPEVHVLAVGNVQYELSKLHFHKPAAHVLNGEYYPFELRWINQKPGGNPAIIVVLLKVGRDGKEIQKIINLGRKDNKEIQKLIDTWNSKKGFVDINPEMLLPHDTTIYAYKERLQGGARSRFLEWYVFKEPLMISAGQANELNRLLNLSARPRQGPPVKAVDLYSPHVSIQKK